MSAITEALLDLIRNDPEALALLKSAIREVLADEAGGAPRTSA